MQDQLRKLTYLAHLVGYIQKFILLPMWELFSLMKKALKGKLLRSGVKSSHYVAPINTRSPLPMFLAYQPPVRYLTPHLA